MRKKYIPVIVATQDALRQTLAEGLPILYVDNILYLQDKDAVHKIMADMGYKSLSKRGKQGIFYVKTNGDGCFQEGIHDIYDPLDIL